MSLRSICCTEKNELQTEARTQKLSKSKKQEKEKMIIIECAFQPIEIIINLFRA